jgi:hypothetical protein
MSVTVPITLYLEKQVVVRFGPWSSRLLTLLWTVGYHCGFK